MLGCAASHARDVGDAIPHREPSVSAPFQVNIMSVIRSVEWLRYTVSRVHIIYVKLRPLYTVPRYSPGFGYFGLHVHPGNGPKTEIFKRPTDASTGVFEGSNRW